MIVLKIVGALLFIIMLFIGLIVRQVSKKGSPFDLTEESEELIINNNKHD